VTTHRCLAEVAADRAADPAELHAALLAATVYCERGDEPGFRALGREGAGVIPVFSSVEQLALARGGVAWFACTGADLLTELPAGYDLLLDMGGQAPLRLRPDALERQVVIEVETTGGR
jgi:SseB protein N-terminal domain